MEKALYQMQYIIIIIIIIYVTFKNYISLDIKNIFCT